jgi:hypothetical protein
LFNKIKTKKDIKISHKTQMKILTSSPNANSVLVTDLKKGITIIYPSARNAALALNASNSTVMNKIKGKNLKIFKNRYLIHKHCH